MEPTVLEIFKILVPGLVAVIGNIIFYTIVKSRIDRSIETYKIAYSGIFKERMDIYKNILATIYKIRSKIMKFTHVGGKKFGFEIMQDFNEMIEYYEINKPYLSDSIIKKIQKLIQEFQSCFDDAFKYHYLRNFPDISDKDKAESIKKVADNFKKMTENETFQPLMDALIQEMKKELNIPRLK